MTEVSDEERSWRRKFAGRANNRAWSLTEQASRTADEDREMLDAAHAAMHLWSAIGTPRNLALAQLLLGQVHAILGNAQYAVGYAGAALDQLKGSAGDTADLAIPYAVMANAAQCAGNAALHESNYRAAERLIAQMPNGGDRAIAEATLRVVPTPR